MENLRMDSYQPFSWQLVKRHGLSCVLLWGMGLPMLFFQQETAKWPGVLLLFFLSLLAVLDMHYGLLYDKLLLPWAALGIALEVLACLPWGLAEAAEAAALAGAFFGLLRFLSGGGLGWGDVKFIAVSGLWLGVEGVLVAIALAVSMGGILGIALLFGGSKPGDALPFGPCLSLGVYGAYVFGDSLWQFYWGQLLT